MKYLPAILALVPVPVLAAMRNFTVREVVWDIVIIVGVGIIFGLLNFLIDKAPFLDAPWKQYAKYFLIVVAVIIVIYLILDFLGL